MNRQQMDIHWKGPFDWPLPRQDSPLRRMLGVYMTAAEGTTGYVVSGIGLTKRAVSKRFGEHRREFLKGKYTILDVNAWKKGIREEIWHGMWSGYDSSERKAEFKRRETELQEHARTHMQGTSIFVAEVEDNRLQHRIEASYIEVLYTAPKPYCDLPDRGTHRKPRQTGEVPIVVTNHSDCLFVNLPATVEI